MALSLGILNFEAKAEIKPRSNLERARQAIGVDPNAAKAPAEKDQ